MKTPVFPRPGEPIVPQMLADLASSDLRALDATIWQRASIAACRRYAVLAARHFRPLLEHPMLRDRALPPMPELNVLALRRRTLRCLREAIASGLISPLPEMEGRPLADLLVISGFGSACLLDFLAAVETFNAGGPLEPPPEESQLPAEQHFVCLEDELFALTEAAGTERNQRMVTLRMGWDGIRRRTLQEVAERFRMTRERVRQICDAVAREVARRQPVTIYVNRALDLLRREAPIPLEEAAEALARERIAKDAFSPEGVLAAAEILGLSSDLQIIQAYGMRVVAGGGDIGLPKVVWYLARRATEHYGLGTLEDLSVKAREILGVETPVDRIRQLLVGIDGFQWLSDENDWFCLSSVPRNRLRNYIEKIMSVATAVDLNTLREAVRRPYRMAGFAPPRSVLRRFCAGIPFCEVDGDFIRARGAPPWQEVLASTEQTIVGFFSQSELLTREELAELARGTGLKKDAMSVALGYSPIVQRFAPSVYGLVGATPTPGQVESLVRRGKPDRVRLDHGWIKGTRRLWVSFKLSPAAILEGVVSVPASLAPLLDGKYSLLTGEGDRWGAAVVQNRLLRGLRQAFARTGSEPGDLMIAVFNPDDGTVVLYFGDDDLVEQFSTRAAWLESTPSEVDPKAKKRRTTKRRART